MMKIDHKLSPIKLPKTRFMMNLTMPQPMAYPFYMGTPRLPYSVPWSSNPFPFHPPSPITPVSYPLPFILSHQPRPNPPPKVPPTYSSYTNMRYNHLKQSTSYMNRHRSIDTSLHTQRYVVPNQEYRPMKTTSVSDFQQLAYQNSAHLLKAHSWHAINHLTPPNFSISHARQIPIIQEDHSQHHYRQRSPKRKRKSHRNRSSSPKQLPESGLVRVSTYDEMPMIHNPVYKGSPSYSNQTQKTQKSAQINSNRRSSPSSTTSSRSSFQKRLNGSLRNDPLLIAAMEDFRQLRRTSSRSTSITAHQRDISRDSLCSNSTHHSSSSISRSHSQSSFTSLERLEIRNLIKSLKSKGLQTVNMTFQSTPISPPVSEPCLIKKASPIPIVKVKKSSITEELDREFRKLRSTNPNQEVTNVKPSSIHKSKHFISPLPVFDELLHQVQMQTFKQIDDKPYENPITPIPIPQGSPISPTNDKTTRPTKPEYAIPVKKHSEIDLRSIKKDQQIRSFSFCKPMNDILNETRPTRPLSMFNRLQCGLTNPLPNTFHPRTNLTVNENNYDKSLVKENIYASDIDVHLPLSSAKDYLNNHASMTDYFSDYKETSTATSSIINDVSRLFTRSGHRKQEEKSKFKSKFQKSNQHVRCSIM